MASASTDPSPLPPPSDDTITDPPTGLSPSGMPWGYETFPPNGHDDSRTSDPRQPQTALSAFLSLVVFLAVIFVGISFINSSAGVGMGRLGFKDFDAGIDCGISHVPILVFGTQAAVSIDTRFHLLAELKNVNHILDIWKISIDSGTYLAHHIVKKLRTKSIALKIMDRARGAPKSESIEQWLEGVDGALSIERKSPGYMGGIMVGKQSAEYSSSSSRVSEPNNTQQQRLFYPTKKPRMKTRSGMVMGKKKPKKTQKAQQSQTRAAGAKRQVQFDGPTEELARKRVKRGRADPESDDSDLAARSTSRTTKSSYFKTSSTRLQLNMLATASPSLFTIPLGEGPLPSAVKDVFTEIINCREALIPRSIEGLFSKRYPFDIWCGQVDPSSAPTPTSQDEELFEALCQIYENAKVGLIEHEDENHWSDVVRAALTAAAQTSPKINGPDMIRITPAQTLSIAPASLLPKIDNIVRFKKVDLLLSFSLQNPEVALPIRNARKNHPGLLLAQTEDGTAGVRSHFAAIEIKSPDGSYFASALQLETWLAAGLEKMGQLQTVADGSQGDEPGLPFPFIGLSVIGNTWYFHVAAKAENGDVTLYGPITAGDTLSLRGIFQIFNVLWGIRKWGETVYWPWLRDQILTPLANTSSQRV